MKLHELIQKAWEALPKWGSVQECPKCKAVRDGTAHYNMAGYCPGAEVRWDPGGTTVLPHMVLTCWHCGYSWSEKEADATDAKAQAEGL